MKSPDLTYRTTGLFTRFCPETPAGELPWSQIGADGVVLTTHIELFAAELLA